MKLYLVDVVTIVVFNKTLNLVTVLIDGNIGPPLSQISVLVVQSSAVVEAMSQLVAKNCPNRSVIQCSEKRFNSILQFHIASGRNELNSLNTKIVERKLKDSCRNSCVRGTYKHCNFLISDHRSRSIRTYVIHYERVYRIDVSWLCTPTIENQNEARIPKNNKLCDYFDLQSLVQEIELMKTLQLCCTPQTKKHQHITQILVFLNVNL